MSGRSIFRLVINALFIVGGLWVVFNFQYVVDSYNAWQYKPSPEIVSITERTDLSDKGRFYFYASSPALSDRDQFNATCTKTEEFSVILGCYVVQKIYIYDINDERLDGIKEVTSAHEMLHAAYERLPSSEKERVNSMIRRQISSINSESFKERLAVYDKVETSERINELHSILATEVDQLSDELEQYYGQYFNDRTRVVALFKMYEKTFTDLKSKQQDLVSKLENLSVQINDQTADYNADNEVLNQDVSNFNIRAQNGSYNSEEEFNFDRNELLARQALLEQERAEIEQMIDEYNKIIGQIDEVNVIQESLNRSIDSNLDEPSEL